MLFLIDEQVRVFPSVGNFKNYLLELYMNEIFLPLVHESISKAKNVCSCRTELFLKHTNIPLLCKCNALKWLAQFVTDEE